MIRLTYLLHTMIVSCNEFPEGSRKPSVQQALERCLAVLNVLRYSIVLRCALCARGMVWKGSARSWPIGMVARFWLGTARLPA